MKRYVFIILGILIALTLLFLIKDGGITGMVVKKEIRPEAVAGQFYPADKKELSEMVEGFLNKIDKVHAGVKALIVPHAGYIFSGQVAAVSFKQIANDDYERVILLGPSHYYPLRGISLLDVDYYKTPLGEIKLDKKVIREILKEDIANKVEQAHLKEHSIEVELPFLQKTLKDFKLVPILVGEVAVDELVEILMKHLDAKTLLVVSVDLSHFHPYDEAKSLDLYCLNKISKLEPVDDCEIDAPWAVNTLLEIAKKKNWKPHALFYANSGDVTGDKTRVVGYSSVVFYEEDQNLNKEDQKFLLKLTRETLEKYLTKKETPKVNEEKLSGTLLKKQGCFVTLNKKKSGMLRGCIGHIIPQVPLYKCVIENSISAATRDTRFRPVEKAELEDLHIEISVLSVPQKLNFKDWKDLLSKLTKEEGVILEYKGRSATYLPQVWEGFKEKEKFLTSLCLKAGLKAECWKEKDLRVSTYTAFVFHEE